MKCSEITYRPLSELVLLETNPRTIKKADMDRLVDSIKSMGSGSTDQLRYLTGLANWL